MSDSLLPKFVFAGFPRTGSQFVQKCLQLHPEIDYCVKPRFFNDDESYARGLDYYQSMFSDYSVDKVIGEGDEHYLSKEARFADPLAIAERIHAVLPHAKIVICIRNQIDFLLSGFRYWKRSGISAPFSSFMRGWPEEGVAFAKIADFCPYVVKYIALFGKENVKIMFHEDLADSDHAFLEDLFSFLGVAPSAAAKILGKLSAYHDVNPAPSRTLSRLFDLANALRMKNPGALRWVFPIRLYRSLSTLEYKLFGSSARDFRALLSAQETEMIRRRYSEGNIELSSLLDVDLKAKGYPV